MSAVLNLYWDLVSFNEAVRIKEQALETAQKLYDGNKKQVEIGAMAGIEVTRAAAEVSASKEDLLIAQTNLAQQEIVLKNALNRNSMQNTWLDDVHIMPLDHIEIPKTEEIRPVQDLISGGPGEPAGDRAQQDQSSTAQKIMLKGNKNGLLPNLQAFAELTNHGLAGPANPLYNNCCGAPNAFSSAATATCSRRLFRRNFPDYSAGFSLNIPFRNRAAAGRLRDRPVADAADRIAVAAHDEPGAGGCEDGGDRTATGAGTLRDGGGYAHARRTEPGGRAKPLQVRRGRRWRR